MRIPIALLLAVLLWSAAAVLCADEDNTDLKVQINELRALIKQIQADYEAKLATLEEQIEELSAKAEMAEIMQETQSEVMDAVQEEAITSARTAAAAGGAQQSMNPDLSVIVDWTGHSVSGDEEPGGNDDKFNIRHVELGYSAEIDPYARADIFIGIGEGHHHHAGLVEHAEADSRHEEETSPSETSISIGEAYLTLPALGPSLQAKVGKFMTEFGRAGSTHLHALPWVTYPRAVDLYLGGHGMLGVGVSFGWMLPTRHFSELTLQAVNAQSNSFADNDANNPTYVAHWRNFIDISAASALEIGASYALGPTDPYDSDPKTRLWGADLTYKWRPLEEGLYRSLWWQSEGYWSKRDLEDGESEDAWGTYSSLNWQFDRRWYAGARYDYVEDPFDSSYKERSWSVNTTLAPSEFQYWRVEYRRVDPNFGDARNEYWLQYNFGIGPHRAHKF
jgi:hypothetical protein